MKPLFQVACALLLILVTRASAQLLPVSSPEAQGVSSKSILAFIEAFEKEVDSPHGIVILRNGHTIAQGWWAPYERDDTHILYSLSKSFTSTAIGLLADEGKLDIDASVLSCFPDEAPANPSDNLKAMRIRDLLSMTTGHTQDTLGKLASAGDGNWARAFLAQPVDRQPGTHFIYNSGATYMLSAIVQKVSGKTLIEYLKPKLFEPLGIANATWDSDPKGINVGGWGLRITTNDIATFGQLYLQNGIWNGKRLLSESWIQLATSAQTANGTNANSDWNQGYGFQFWRCRHGAYRGDGAFGQFCIVMPQQKLVIAITAGQGDMQKTLNLVWQHLLPGLHLAALPADDLATKALVHKMGKLSHAVVQGEATSPMAAKIMGKTFTLEANSAGIKTVTLALQGDKPHVIVQGEQGEQKFEVGTGQWRKSEVIFHKLGLAAAATTGKEKFATSGAWTKSDQFTARAWLTSTPFRVDMDFTFDADGESVTMNTRLHPMQGKSVTIKGATKS